jgi:hypothetical protein
MARWGAQFGVRPRRSYQWKHLGASLIGEPAWTWTGQAGIGPFPSPFPFPPISARILPLGRRYIPKRYRAPDPTDSFIAVKRSSNRDGMDGGKCDRESPSQSSVMMTLAVLLPRARSTCLIRAVVVSHHLAAPPLASRQAQAHRDEIEHTSPHMANPSAACTPHHRRPSLQLAAPVVPCRPAAGNSLVLLMVLVLLAPRQHTGSSQTPRITE